VARERKIMTIRMQSREIANYVERLLQASQPDSAIGSVLSNWVKTFGTALGIDFTTCIVARGAKPARRHDDSKPLSHAAWRRLTAAVAKASARLERNALACNGEILGNALELTDAENAIFILIALAKGDSAFWQLCSSVMSTRLLHIDELIARCTGICSDEVEQALTGGALGVAGLVDGNPYRMDEFHYYIPFEIMRALRVPEQTLAAIEHALLGRPSTSDLVWSDFDFVAAERDFAARLLKNAVAARQSGINILIYGPPGTGKTELAKIIAREAGCEIYAVGETDDRSDEPTRYDRLTALRLNDRLLHRRGGACLLFDEMEDILQSGDASFVGGRRIRSAGSKVYFNRLLERNAVPVIWITNSIEEFDRAFLRRMSFAVEMKTPPRHVRATQWAHMADEAGLRISIEAANTLAETHQVPPSLARSAIAATRTAEAQAEKIDFVITGLSKAATGVGARAPRSRHCAPDGNLFNADYDLSALEQALGALEGARDVSFCFYGPPGTGKSIYARRLAELMRFDACERRGSDFLSKWVGETEARIARTFEDAVGDGKFLIIDEVESLLWNRTGAAHSWESSMVNEFLTAIECHPLPIACTTNHLEQIDPAVLRRFSFKIKFDSLRPDQALLAFERFFDMAAPNSLVELPGLTLGDFATVQKQIRVLGASQRTPERASALLEAEMQAKLQNARKIGF
jgi:AAA+ superfamily predicted ATPase